MRLYKDNIMTTDQIVYLLLEALQESRVVERSEDDRFVITRNCKMVLVDDNRFREKYCC